MKKDLERIVETCKEFVRTMSRTEVAISEMDKRLSIEEMRTAFQDVLDWLATTDEIPANSFTRELAREILGQLSGILALKDYKGSADRYIA